MPDGHNVANGLHHEEIARRLIEAKVLDFEAMGRFISEFGPELALRDSGWHGINIGRYNILACMMPASDLARLVGDLRVASLTTAALEQAAKASLPQ